MCAKIALAQMSAAAHTAESLKAIERFAQQAGEQGADLLVLPEYAKRYPQPDEALTASPAEQQYFLDSLCAAARRQQIYLVCGMYESGEQGKIYNATAVIDRQGRVVRMYRKSQLFASPHYRESDHFLQGNRLFEPLDTDFGRLGLLVCYEIRFPELARLQAIHGAQLLIVASAFVAGPGKKQQWHTLLQARAIENGCFVCASNLTGPPILFGESCAYDPYGNALGRLGEEEGLLLVDCAVDKLDRMRRYNPAVLQRRPDLYRFACE